MKTKFITSVMAIIFAGASLFAADPAATIKLVNQKGSTIYKVVCSLPGAGRAFLKISGSEGVLLTETVSYTNGFAYPFDLKGLADGKYTVEVLTKNARFKETLELEKTKPVAYVRATEQPGNKHLLTITSDEAADFTIRVFDNMNNEIFAKVETVKENYGVVLNMANLAGGYYFEVTEASGNVNVIRK